MVAYHVAGSAVVGVLGFAGGEEAWKVSGVVAVLKAVIVAGITEHVEAEYEAAG